ncbi:MAG: hypothetical protein OXC79_08085, partial [Candidatus Poribacteria bacterium]|nr:hypothetical protein [Candidatus Poribacteria bacterium]
PPYHRLDLRGSRKSRYFGLPVTEFIKIWNAYFFLHQNSMRLGVSSRVLDVIENIAPEDLPEDFDPATLESIKVPQIPFLFSVGVIYEF